MPAKPKAAGEQAAAAAGASTGKGDLVLTRVFDSQDFDVLPDLAELMADRASKVQQQLQSLHSNLQAAQTTAASLALSAASAAQSQSPSAAAAAATAAGASAVVAAAAAAAGAGAGAKAAGAAGAGAGATAAGDAKQPPAAALNNTTAGGVGGGLGAGAGTGAGAGAGAGASTHRCRVFDIPALLVDQRWLGTDKVRVELADPDPERAVLAAMVFRRALQGIKADIQPTRDGSLAISNIKFEKKVDPTPILKLIEYALWCEPNKLEHMQADTRTEVIDDYRRFEQALHRELGQCQVDEKLMIESLKAARQHAAAQQLAAQTAAQTAAHTAALSAAVAAGAGGTAKDAKSDAAAIAAAAAAAAAAAVAAAPTTAAAGSSATAAAAAAAAVAAAAPRAGGASGSAAANIRGSECFQRIEKKRAALTHVLKAQLRDVGRIVCCKACDRVIEVYTKPADPMNGLVLAEMKSQIAELEAKIKEAHGIDNKQKRKRLQRKLKELESRAKFLGYAA